MKRILPWSFLFLLFTPVLAQQKQSPMEHIHGVGNIHMDVSCSPYQSADFEFALALLHNFWYPRALEVFNKVIQADPQCAMAYWGAAMTHNHPFWDAPSLEDESAAWALVQKGMQATKKTPREKMYLVCRLLLEKKKNTARRSVGEWTYSNDITSSYSR